MPSAVIGRCSAPSTRRRPCWPSRRALGAFSSRITSSPSQRVNSAAGSPPPPPPTTTTSASRVAAARSPRVAGDRGPAAHRRACCGHCQHRRRDLRAGSAAPCRERGRRGRRRARRARHATCASGRTSTQPDSSHLARARPVVVDVGARRGRGRSRTPRSRRPCASRRACAASTHASPPMPVSSAKRPLPARSWVETLRPPCSSHSAAGARPATSSGGSRARGRA